MRAEDKCGCKGQFQAPWGQIREEKDTMSLPGVDNRCQDGDGLRYSAAWGQGVCLACSREIIVCLGSGDRRIP